MPCIHEDQGVIAIYGAIRFLAMHRLDPVFRCQEGDEVPCLRCTSRALLKDAENESVEAILAGLIAISWEYVKHELSDFVADAEAEWRERQDGQQGKVH